MTQTTTDEKYLTVRQAAMRLGKSPGRVRQLALAGRIRNAEKVGRDWVIKGPLEVLSGERGPNGAAVALKEEPLTSTGNACRTNRVGISSFHNSTDGTTEVEFIVARVIMTRRVEGDAVPCSLCNVLRAQDPDIGEIPTRDRAFWKNIAEAHMWDAHSDAYHTGLLLASSLVTVEP